MQNLFVGKNLIELDTIDSTNNYAANALKLTDLAEGTVIMTHNQVSGRGQHGTVWQSESGKNLTFSLILYPKMVPIQDQFIISKITALGILKTLKSFGLRNVQIKWPNDIYVGNNKIAGILIENQLQGNKLKHAILGIGLNVNQQTFDNSINATSLIKETGEEFNKKEVLERLCSYIEVEYLKLQQGALNRIDIDYIENLLGYKQAQKFIDLKDNHPFLGEIVGVTKSGYLQVKVFDVIKNFDLKELKFIF